jgi:hypothetical protein
MRRYLLGALWPAGIAAIMATTVIKARQAGGIARRGNGGGRRVAMPASAAGSGVAAAAGLGSGLADSELQGTARTGYPAGLVPGVFRRAAEPVMRRDWALGLLRLGAISCADGALSYGVMALLGRVVLSHGPAIDEPIVGWTTQNQIDWWAAVTERLNRIGRRSTIRGAAGTAAVCLAVTWRERKWLPPAVLAAVPRRDPADRRVGRCGGWAGPARHRGREGGANRGGRSWCSRRGR